MLWGMYEPKHFVWARGLVAVGASKPVSRMSWSAQNIEISNKAASLYIILIKNTDSYKKKLKLILKVFNKA